MCTNEISLAGEPDGYYTGQVVNPEDDPMSKTVDQVISDLAAEITADEVSAPKEKGDGQYAIVVQLTVCQHTRLGRYDHGAADADSIGSILRSAARRFGANDSRDATGTKPGCRHEPRNL